MTPDEFNRMRELFDAACDVSADRRDAYLEALCADDPDLLGRLRRLLNIDSCHDSPVDRPAVCESLASAASVAPILQQPEQIGRFRVLGQIGSGGMGAVYEAEQQNPRRTVALKIIQPDNTSPGARRRFENEAQILAQLRHPGIGHVYEAGVADLGRGPQPYFAMELIRGESIIAHARTKKMDTIAKLDLFARVCDAVDHAHRNGVIHRDLKPANILVDASGQPKVLDFGVARWTGDSLASITRHTATGQVIGTLNYMSPEQVRGQSESIDARSDVYALGVILYQLLTDRLPYNVDGSGLAEVVRMICEHEHTRLRSLHHGSHPDLDTIVAKTLEKDPARRYASAAALAEDVRRYLRDEPIVARPQTWSYQLHKFARRNRALVAGVVAAFVFLILGSIASIHQAVIATRARDEARALERDSRRQAYRAALTAAAMAIENHNVALARSNLETAPAAFRGWEWRYLHTRLDDAQLCLNLQKRTLHQPSRFADADRVIEMIRRDRPGLLRWDANTGKSLPDRLMPAPDFVLNRTGTAGVAKTDNGFVVRDTASGQDHNFTWQDFGLAGPVKVRLMISEDGRKVLVRYHPDHGGPCWLDLDRHDVASVRIPTAGSHLHDVSIDPQDRVAIAQAIEARPAVWNPRTGELLALPGVSSAGACVDHSPDATRLVVGMRNGVIAVWDTQVLEKLGDLVGHEDLVSGVTFRPDGKVLASTSHDRTVRLWDVSALEPIAVLHGHEAAVFYPVFSGDGARLATRGDDDTLRVWDATMEAPAGVLKGHTSYVYPVAFSPDDAIIASSGWDRQIRLWNNDTQDLMAVLTGHEGYVVHLLFSPDGRYLLSLGNDGIRFWEVATRRQVNHLRERHTLRYGIRAHPPAVAIWDGPFHVREWDPRTGDVRQLNCAELGSFASPFVSPARDVFVARDSGTSAAGYATFRLLDGAASSVSGLSPVLSFSPSGEHIAARDLENPSVVRVWDVATGERLAELPGNAGQTFCVRYHPDGSRLTTSGRDQMIRIWETERYEQLVALRGHTSYVWSLDWNRDGSRMVSGSGDYTVRLWRTTPLRRRTERE